MDKRVKQMEFDIGNSKKYKIKAIYNNMVYIKKS